MQKIVTLIPSATEIVAFLGKQDLIVGKSHECDFPKSLENVVKLTSPKINVNGKSGEIHKQINEVLAHSLSVYKVNIDELKRLKPDVVITQAHCEVCAVSFSEVEQIVIKHLNEKTYKGIPILGSEDELTTSTKYHDGIDESKYSNLNE